MMEHTINSYLQRLSTERIKEFLRQYEAGELKEDFSYIIPYARAELRRRENSITKRPPV